MITGSICEVCRVRLAHIKTCIFCMSEPDIRIEHLDLSRSIIFRKRLWTRMKKGCFSINDISELVKKGYLRYLRVLLDENLVSTEDYEKLVAVREEFAPTMKLVRNQEISKNSVIVEIIKGNVSLDDVFALVKDGHVRNIDILKGAICLCGKPIDDSAIASLGKTLYEYASTLRLARDGKLTIREVLQEVLCSRFSRTEYLNTDDIFLLVKEGYLRNLSVLHSTGIIDDVTKDILRGTLLEHSPTIDLVRSGKLTDVKDIINEINSDYIPQNDVVALMDEGYITHENIQDLTILKTKGVSG